MKSRVTEIIIGCLIGLAATAIGTTIHLLYLSNRDGLSISEIINFAKQQGNIGAIIVMGAILNLVAFFLLLRFNQDIKAKGVLIVTFIMAIILMIYKMF